jgi:hypothetical protein
MFGVMLTSCATQAASAAYGPGNFYSDSVTVGVKCGEESNSIVLGLFGSGYPRVEKVARENGIKKIATVEHYSRPGFLFLWKRYTTIVTGE